MDTRVGALAGLHVLVVEDNNDARDILSMVLQYFGALVTAAADAAGALKDLRRIAPDVVVADIQLPDHNAPWLIRATRRLPSAVPFILVSALDHDPATMSDWDFEAYLRKPVDHVKLVDTILAVTRRQRGP
jgi:DNA-binding response OmpR family regulator